MMFGRPTDGSEEILAVIGLTLECWYIMSGQPHHRSLITDCVRKLYMMTREASAPHSLNLTAHVTRLKTYPLHIIFIISLVLLWAPLIKEDFIVKFKENSRNFTRIYC